MKKLIVLWLVALLIAGCDIVPQFYDNNEYLILAEIETSSRLLHGECVDTNYNISQRVNTLYEKAEVFRTYTFYQPQNEVVAEQANIIADNIGELRQRYRRGEPSESYCQLKAEAITIASQRALMAIGNKPRQ